jgi:hypothetical protein
LVTTATELHRILESLRAGDVNVESVLRVLVAEVESDELCSRCCCKRYVNHPASGWRRVCWMRSFADAHRQAHAESEAKREVNRTKQARKRGGRSRSRDQDALTG